MENQTKPNLFDDQSSRKWLIDLLLQQSVKVTFTKVDGSERVMECTLNKTSIPEEHHPKTESEKPEEIPDHLRVYEPAVSGWRAFKFSAIKQIEFDV